ncbi:MAG: hypothetical protein ABSF33_02405 [Acidimicrobiales bacterium]
MGLSPLVVTVLGHQAGVMEDGRVGQALRWHTPSVLSDEASLAMSIDLGHVPITIHLEGTLDGRTGSNVVAVVSELIADGSRQFELDISDLRVPDAGGVEVLADLQLAVRTCGGTLQRLRPAVTHPSPVRIRVPSDRPVTAQMAPGRILHPA